MARVLRGWKHFLRYVYLLAFVLIGLIITKIELRDLSFTEQITMSLMCAAADCNHRSYYKLL